MRRLAIVTSVIAVGLYVCVGAFVIYTTQSPDTVQALPTIPFIAALVAFRLSSIRWLAWTAAALNALAALVSVLALLWALIGGGIVGVPSVLLPLTAVLTGAAATFNAIALMRGTGAARAPLRL
jgi:hypothetical protein